jgi:uncharacterized protein
MVMDMTEEDRLLTGSMEIMEHKMKQYDPSHDGLHVMRVYRMADRIAKELIEQGESIDLTVVRLAAIFHDMSDHKYETPSQAEETNDKLYLHMTSHGLDRERADLVLRIIKNVSYSNEIRLKQSNLWTEWHEKCCELHW